MVAIGHCQYSWTLFVGPFQRVLDASQAEIQLGFSAFVLMQTTSVLGLGVLAPNHRQRQVVAFGATCLLAALQGLAASSSLQMLHASAALMGIGVGAAYSVCMAISVSVYPAHRGLAAGVVAAGYGAGTLPTIALIEGGTRSLGYAATLRALSYGIAGTCLLVALLLPPVRGGHAAADADADAGSCVKSGALRPHASAGGAPARPQLRLVEAACLLSFWTLYVMLVLIAFVGLVVTAQLKPIASSYGIESAAVVAALQADRVLNGVSRPLWGWLSDVAGRENALGLAFALQAAVLLAWSQLLAERRAFVVCSALSTFSWGEIYSLFPALAADLYGTEHIGQTYGALYTGKAVASLLAGPVSSMIASRSSWEVIVLAMAAASAVDAFLALVVLKRLLRDEAR